MNKLLLLSLFLAVTFSIKLNHQQATIQPISAQVAPGGWSSTSVDSNID